MINRAAPEALRESREAARLLTQQGIAFVVVPYATAEQKQAAIALSDKHFDELIAQAGDESHED